MPQLPLPMFPHGVTHITPELAVQKREGQVTYFNGHMPIFDTEGLHHLDPALFISDAAASNELALTINKPGSVSNLPWGVTDDDVRVLFSPYGRVKQATVIIDNRGRSKGFGFVDMQSADAHRAMRALDGSRLSGRPLKVKVAAPRARQN